MEKDGVVHNAEHWLSGLLGLFIDKLDDGTFSMLFSMIYSLQLFWGMII